MGAEISTQHEYLGRGARRGCPRGALDHHARGKARRGDAVPGRGEAGGSVLDRRRIGGGYEAPDRQLLSRCPVSLRSRSDFGFDRQGRLPELSPALGQFRCLVRAGVGIAATGSRQLRSLVMQRPRAEPMTVIGAGSWGTALAIQLAREGHPTQLWGRDGVQLDAMRRTRRNARYLPDAGFPDTLQVAGDLREALEAARDALIAVPSHAFRTTLESIKPLLGPDTRIAWATKGFEIETGQLPHQIARQVLGKRPGAVLSGPTFAKEVGAGLPTAMTVASRDERFAKELAVSLSGPNFRAYTQTDIMGVEVGGAVKNVIAIGSGIADGMGFGANTRVALITRGLAEMMRLGVKLGAVRETFMGLAGLGDLVLTCTDDQSRNRRFGMALGRGQSLRDAASGIHQVVEGLPAARAVYDVAQRLMVDMPICQEVYRVMHEGKPVRAAVQALMGREVRSEAE